VSVVRPAEETGLNFNPALEFIEYELLSAFVAEPVWKK